MKTKPLVYSDVSKFPNKKTVYCKFSQIHKINKQNKGSGEHTLGWLLHCNFISKKEKLRCGFDPPDAFACLFFPPTKKKKKCYVYRCQSVVFRPIVHPPPQPTPQSDIFFLLLKMGGKKKPEKQKNKTQMKQNLFLLAVLLK